MESSAIDTASHLLAPFQPGVFERDGDALWLLGSKCQSCGRHFFPRVPQCLDCLARDVIPVSLSGVGELECFTRVFMPALRLAPPYDVGYVRLPEGVRVFAPLQAGAATLAVGMKMALVLFRIGRPDAMAYGFAPVTS